ncbi:hypothetical protein SMG44B_10003 [Stenotrophomonas maltophilia]
MIITSIERHTVYHARKPDLESEAHAGFIPLACGKLGGIK